MKNIRFVKQTAEIFLKILISFIIVFMLYFSSEFVNNFVYDYFIFPLLSITIIFICGVNVGRSLERIKINQNLVMKHGGSIKKTETIEKTEFIINDTNNINKSKKILKEVEEGDKIHIKVINYNDINDEGNCE